MASAINAPRKPGGCDEAEAPDTLDLADRTCRFRGNTLVDVTPPLAGTLYQRRPQMYSRDKAPTKKVARYVTDVRLQW